MCGRYTLTADLDFIIERFQIAYDLQFEYQPRYNIAPSQEVLAVIKGEKGNKLGQLKWGLIPSWANDPKISYKMINARSETAAQKTSFKKPLQYQRCLIIADSFYEWKKIRDKKQPYRIMLKNTQPFAFAGLWSVWHHPEGEKIATCTILTTSSNKIMADLHNRMPVILNKNQEELWLDPTLHDVGTLSSFFSPYPDEQMKVYPVSPLVNSPRNEGPELLEEIPL